MSEKRRSDDGSLDWAEPANVARNIWPLLKMIADGRKRPSTVIEHRVDEAEQTYKRRMMLAMKHNVSVEKLTTAEFVIRRMKYMGTFFHYLNRRIRMDSESEEIVSDVITKILNVNDSDALRTVTANDFDALRIVSVIEHYDYYVKEVRLPPVGLTMLVNDLKRLSKAD